MSTGAAKRKRGKRAPAQSRGLVPQALKGGAGTDGEVFEFLTKIAGLVHPGVSNLEELDPQDQKSWIRFREATTRGHHSLAELVKTLGEALSLQAAAQIEDLRERREAELAEGKERAAAALEDQDQRREEKKARLGQDLKERETRRTNESRRDNLLMVITALSFVFTIGLILYGVASEQQVAFGLSALGAVGSAAGVRRLFVVESSSPADDRVRSSRGSEQVSPKP